MKYTIVVVSQQCLFKNHSLLQLDKRERKKYMYYVYICLVGNSKYISKDYVHTMRIYDDGYT